MLKLFTRAFATALPPRRRRSSRRTRQQSNGTEHLERKVVLSAISVSGNTVFYNAAPGELNDLVVTESGGTLTFSDTGATISPGAGSITVVNANEVTIPTAGITTLNISLEDLDDSFDGSGVGATSGITLAIINGGDGSDDITGTQTTDSITVLDSHTGSDSIDALGQPFGQRDAIRITSDADVTATNTTFQVGAFISSYANLELIDVTGGSGDNVIDLSGITPSGSFTNVQVNGGAGNDTITGSQLADSVVISGVNPGGDSIDLQGQPAGARDSLRFSLDLDVTITDTTLTVDGVSGSIANVEFIPIDGGPSNNTFDLSGITASGTVEATQINAGNGDDTIIGSQLADTIVISGANPGADTVDGQSQPAGTRDSLFINADVDVTMTNSLLQIGTNIGSQTNIESLSLNGGAGDNVFDLSGIDSSGSFERIQVTPGAGNDTVTGSQLADTFIVSGFTPGADSFDGQGNTGGEDIITITADADYIVTDTTYSIDAVVSTYANLERMNLSGGNGNNLLDVRAITAASGLSEMSLVGNGGDDTIIPGDFSVTQNVFGRFGFDVLDFSYATVSPNVTITGPGSFDGNVGTYAAGTFNNIDSIILPPEYDFSSATYSVAEGNSTNTTTVVEVTRSVNTSIASSVDVVLTGNTATAGDDFTAGPVSISFLPGETTKSVAIELLGDTAVEGDETIDLSLAGGIIGTTQPSATLTITNDDTSNQPPLLLAVETDATFSNRAQPGETVTFTGVFTDPDAGDTHTAVINWGDGTTSLGFVDSQLGIISASHTYLAGGIFEVGVTLADSGNETSSAATTAVIIGARVSASGTLEIISTGDNDQISVTALPNDQIQVTTPGADPGIGTNSLLQTTTTTSESQQSRRRRRGQGSQNSQTIVFDVADVTEIVIDAGPGNDRINIASNVTLPAVVYGGDGNDYINSGGGDDKLFGQDGWDVIAGDRGNDIIEGGSGSDQIFGGSGRDILIGGTGLDLLSGSGNDDILIGGTTDYDDDLAGLDTIFAAWTSGDSFADRVNFLSGGLLNSGTVHDDDVIDLIAGGRGDNWFFADRSGRDRDWLFDLDLSDDELTVIW